MTATGKTYANEPAWCVRTDHEDSFIGRHRSHTVQAGERGPAHDGQVTVFLERAGDGPTKVAFNAAHMASTTVAVTVDEAARLRDGLTRLIEIAGHE